MFYFMRVSSSVLWIFCVIFALAVELNVTRERTRKAQQKNLFFYEWRKKQNFFSTSKSQNNNFPLKPGEEKGIFFNRVSINNVGLVKELAWFPAIFSAPLSIFGTVFVVYNGKVIAKGNWADWVSQQKFYTLRTYLNNAYPKSMWTVLFVVGSLDIICGQVSINQTRLSTCVWHQQCRYMYLVHVPVYTYVCPGVQNHRHRLYR